MFSFMRKRPEEVGIPSGAIAAYIRAIEERRLCLHSLLIIRRGALVFEGQWAPMTSTEKHRLYSSSKSFVSMAIGLLVGDGKMSKSLGNFFTLDASLDEGHDHSRFALHGGLPRRHDL